MISITPLRRARWRGSFASGTISTGSILRLCFAAARGLGAISRRHLKTWFAFTS